MLEGTLTGIYNIPPHAETTASHASQSTKEGIGHEESKAVRLGQDLGAAKVPCILEHYLSTASQCHPSEQKYLAHSARLQFEIMHASPDC